MYIVYEDGKYKAVMNFESLKKLLKGGGNYEIFDMNADSPENKLRDLTIDAYYDIVDSVGKAEI